MRNAFLFWVIFSSSLFAADFKVKVNLAGDSTTRDATLSIDDKGNFSARVDGRWWTRPTLTFDPTIGYNLQTVAGNARAIWKIRQDGLVTRANLVQGSTSNSLPIVLQAEVADAKRALYSVVGASTVAWVWRPSAAQGSYQKTRVALNLAHIQGLETFNYLPKQRWALSVPAAWFGSSKSDKSEFYEVRVLKTFQSPGREPVAVVSFASDIARTDRGYNKAHYTVKTFAVPASSLTAVADSTTVEFFGSRKTEDLLTLLGKGIRFSYEVGDFSITQELASTSIARFTRTPLALVMEGLTDEWFAGLAWGQMPLDPLACADLLRQKS